LLIDFHNHHLSSSPDVLSIRSFHQREQEPFEQWTGPCSVGLHPWFVSEVDWVRDEQWDWLTRAARDKKVLLLGECGLDKLQGPDLADQQFVFEHCLALAEQLRKPVVIHCVRAYEELFASVRKIKPTVPMIIHGYARKATILKPLLDQGFYVSYGAAILPPTSAAAQSLAQTPLEKLFLESDDKMLPIADLYARAAQIKGLSIQELETALQNNLETVLRESNK
jgi:TatD DNase family protein